MKIPDGLRAEQVASRMLFLAYEASQIVGMGFLQAKSGVTEDDIFKHQTKGKIDVDYVFGRMMKLRFKYSDTEIIGDPVWRPDYQSFCIRYNNLKMLFDAACLSLKGK